MMLPLAILASGRGSNFQTLVRCIEEGKLAARVALLLSNKPDCGAVEFARVKGIPVWAEPHAAYADREAFDRAMLSAMSVAGVRAVVLAGYMRLLSAPFVRAYAGRILNLHPALLPAFPGARGGTDALAYGVKISGCSVHFVEEALDSGPLVIQAAVPVNAGETEDGLMPRIHALEHRILPQAVQWLAQDRLRLEGRVVRLLPGVAVETSTVVGTNERGAFLVNPPLEGF